MYQWLLKKLKKKSLCSALSLLIIVLIAVVPTTFVVKTLVQESYSVYTTLNEKFGEGIVFCESDGKICNFIKGIEENFFEEGFNVYLSGAMGEISTKLPGKLYGIVIGFANQIVNIFVFLFLVFFLLRDGENLGKNLFSLLPLTTQQKHKAYKQIKELLHAVVFGTIIVALIQGFTGTIGFAIFGVNSPLIFGLLMAFAALIPFIGTSIIWVPVALTMLINGAINSNVPLIWKSVGLIIYGTFIISGIDNILKPRIIGHRSILHPALVLLGVTGGIYLLGPIGIFIGPVIMAFMVILLEIYNPNFKVYSWKGNK